MSYKVTCLDDTGTRVNATSKRWNTEEEARTYVATVAPSRLPEVEQDRHAQHTPGPWEALPALSGSGRVVANGHWIADCKPEDAPIIAAAPDLLAALIDLAERADRSELKDGSSMDTLRASVAIRAARGEQ